MASPPFLIPECPKKPETVKRAHSASEEGSTLEKVAAPVAELRIHYVAQFRFCRFYRMRSATPYWTNADTEPMSKEDLKTAVGGAPSGWLEPDDCFVHFDQRDQHRITIGKATLTVVLGQAERHGTGGTARIWVPIGGVLPKHVPKADAKTAWKAPGLQENSPPANQWGIRGTMDLTLDPCGTRTPSLAYKSVCVWERWKPGKKAGFTSGMAVLPPGTYAGYPKAMGNHSDTKEDMLKYPAIWVGYEWEEPAEDAESTAADKADTDGGKWLTGTHGWRVKNPDSDKLTTSIFIHPGNHPSWFLGCQSPGPAEKQTEWGFAQLEDTRDAMWEILGKMGVTKDSFVKNGKDPSKKNQKWVVIRVTADEDAISSDGWTRQRIWLDRATAPSPASEAKADFTL